MEDKQIPVFLEENGVYKINSLEDLLNCPLNMFDDLVELLRKLNKKRLDYYEKNKKNILVTNSIIKLINDNIKEVEISLFPEEININEDN